MPSNCGAGEDSRGPWTARSSNQSILKEINPEYSLEGLVLKLKLQYFGYLMWTANTFGKDPDPGKDWRSRRRRGWQEDEMVGWHHRLNWDMNLSKLWEIGKDREASSAAVHEVANSWTQLSNWTTNQWVDKDKCVIYYSHAPLHFKQYSIRPSSSLSTDPRNLS